jgi:hypothetical protein
MSTLLENRKRTAFACGFFVLLKKLFTFLEILHILNHMRKMPKELQSNAKRKKVA